MRLHDVTHHNTVIFRVTTVKPKCTQFTRNSHISGKPVVQQKACSDSIIFQTVPHWIIVLETRQMSALLYWCSFRMSCSNEWIRLCETNL